MLSPHYSQEMFDLAGIDKTPLRECVKSCSQLSLCIAETSFWEQQDSLRMQARKAVPCDSEPANTFWTKFEKHLQIWSLVIKTVL